MAADFASQMLTAAKSRIGKDDSSKLKSHEYFKSINFDHLQTRQISAPYRPNLSHASDVSHFDKDAERASEEKTIQYDGDDEWCKDF